MHMSTISRVTSGTKSVCFSNYLKIGASNPKCHLSSLEGYSNITILIKTGRGLYSLFYWSLYVLEEDIPLSSVSNQNSPHNQLVAPMSRGAPLRFQNVGWKARTLLAIVV